MSVGTVWVTTGSVLVVDIVCAAWSVLVVVRSEEVCGGRDEVGGIVEVDSEGGGCESRRSSLVKLEVGGGGCESLRSSLVKLEVVDGGGGGCEPLRSCLVKLVLLKLLEQLKSPVLL